MIRIFISYSNDHNREDAEKLAEVLESTGHIEPILAPREPSHAEENAEKIARLIDGSHFFISFYTKDGKDNHWVNQELGYAFNHVSQYGLKIIPIYEDRDDLKGFLTSQSYNFYNGFNLGDDKMKCFEEVKDYLVGDYRHPVTLDCRYTDEQKMDNGWVRIRGHLIITNTSPKLFSQGTLNIVVPHLMKIGESYNQLAKQKQFIRYDGGSGEENIEHMTHLIPAPFEEKFDIEWPGGVKRLTIFLEDIYDFNAYEVGVVFEYNPKEIMLDYFDFGIYLTTPFFGPTFYQGILHRSEKRLSWSNVDNKEDKVSIKIKGDYLGKQ